MAEQPDLRRAIDRVRSGIEGACARAGRRPDEVVLVAVTKSVPLDVVRAARAAGLTDFGENHARELAEKAPVVPARWHFLGKLQSGTAPRVADHADVVHSAEAGGALGRVAQRAARNGKRIPCRAQVDFSGNRPGVPPEGVEAVLHAV